MKICACIAEYNPFHLGHLKHIDYIKHELGAEKVIVIMSGNFTQRGEPAIMNKFTRARHAIIAGADAVIELPTVFSTQNAEIFAKGAIKLINALNVCDGICFGVESGSKEAYHSLAKALNNESKEFKKILKSKLEQGISLAKAKFETVKELGVNFDESLINFPNNILGVEYTRAILSSKSNLEIYPMLREGSHNDTTLKKGITSATSIRLAIKCNQRKKVKKSLPSFVYKDLTKYPFAFDKLIINSVISTPTEQLQKTPDCTEGLENRIKALVKDNKTFDTLVEKVSTKRYTTTRIQRILINNYLGITSEFVDVCLKEPLYANLLAVSEDGDILATLNKNCTIPLLVRRSDLKNLKNTALSCLEKDYLANELYNLATDDNQHESQTIFV